MTLPATSRATLLALFFLPTLVRADCFIDGFGRERCDGLSVAARVGIAIGIFVAVVFLAIYFSYQRRRRIQQANLLYISQQPHQPQGGYMPPPPPGGFSPQPSNYPVYQQSYQQSPGVQYPPQAHSYDNGAAYAPPSGPPPQTTGGYTAQEPPSYNNEWSRGPMPQGKV